MLPLGSTPVLHLDAPAPIFKPSHPKPPSFNLEDIFSENARHYEVIAGPQLLPNFILQRPVLG